MLLVGVGMALASCGNSQNKKNESPVVDSDKDEHGCIASAGYIWSEVQKDCIRLWEKGVRMESVADKDDDTKNVRQENGRWTISQRGNLIYQQVDEIQ